MSRVRNRREQAGALSEPGLQPAFSDAGIDVYWSMSRKKKLAKFPLLRSLLMLEDSTFFANALFRCLSGINLDEEGLGQLRKVRP
jgi:hypothetical protein